MTPMLGSGISSPLILPRLGLGGIRSNVIIVSIGNISMPDTLFRMMERHQKLDELLRRAQSRRFPDAREILRLTLQKLTLRSRLNGLMGPQYLRPAPC
jgi:hypothetical protein